MKSFVILFFSLLCFFSVQAQSAGKTFYLKNGSIISGIVIEEIPGKQYKVKTMDGNIFVFEAEEIERIILNEVKSEKERTPSENLGNKFYSQNCINIGTMFTEDYNSYNFAVSTVNGININNTLQVGIGLEFQMVEKGTYIPIYLDTQLNFSKTPSTFFAHLSGGIAISNTRENLLIVNIYNGETYEKAINYESGFLGRAGFGYKKEVTNKLKAILGIDYSVISYASNSHLYEDQYLKLDGIYSVVGLKLGVEF